MKLNCAFFYYIGVLYFPDAAMIAKMHTLAQGGDKSGLSAGRLDAITNVVSSFNIDNLFLLFGSGFSISDGNLGTPHNQYIEWFLRGGILFLLFSLYFLIYPIAKMLQSNRFLLVTVGYILLSVLLISNNINTPFRALYISLFLWVLIGLSFKVTNIENAILIRLKNLVPFIKMKLI